jgi:hypothetical protein
VSAFVSGDAVETWEDVIELARDKLFEYPVNMEDVCAQCVARIPGCSSAAMVPTIVNAVLVSTSPPAHIPTAPHILSLSTDHLFHLHTASS